LPIFDFADTLIEGPSDAKIRCDDKDGSCCVDEMDCTPADEAPLETTIEKNIDSSFDQIDMR